MSSLLHSQLLRGAVPALGTPAGRDLAVLSVPCAALQGQCLSVPLQPPAQLLSQAPIFPH